MNTSAGEGALLPPFASPRHSDAGPEVLGEAFTAVVRVPPDAWERTDHALIPTQADFTRRDRQRGIVFGCVPFLDDVDDLRWFDNERGQTRSFRLEVVDSDEIRE